VLSRGNRLYLPTRQGSVESGRQTSPSLSCMACGRFAGVGRAQLCIVVPIATGAPWQVVESTSYPEPTTGLIMPGSRVRISSAFNQLPNSQRGVSSIRPEDSMAMMCRRVRPEELPRFYGLTSRYFTTAYRLCCFCTATVAPVVELCSCAVV